MRSLPYDYGWLHKTLCSLVQPPASVLEVGSSTGRYVHALREEGYEAFGIDGQVQAVKRKGYLRKADASNLPEVFPGRQFEVVVAKGVFSEGAQDTYLFSDPRDFLFSVELRLIGPEGNQAVVNLLHDAAVRLLEHIVAPLGSGGYLITHEFFNEQQLFSEQEAIGCGFAVLRYERGKTILQKK